MARSVAQGREPGLLVVLLLSLCLTKARCSLNDAEDIVSALRASMLSDEQLTQPAADHAFGRSLLQNPDRPALNKYGGVNMTTMLASGYPLETYKVPTPDGWVLSLYRIPYGKNRNNKPGKRPVIYLHHGITLSSACFTLLNANESMAYILADAGFDVWLPNTRGNTFSRGNFYHSYRDLEYWYHTVDEYALIDNPAMVDKALEVSGASKLAWVGHSQGATIGYAMLSGKPEYNAKISVMIQMGPVWFVQYLQAPFLSAMASVRNDNVLTLGNLGEFLWYRTLAPFVGQCRSNFLAEGCVMSLSLLFYGPSAFISIDDYTVIAQTWPASVSSRNMAHFAQMYFKKDLEFRAFDHGTNCTIGELNHETCNQMRYGSTVPPAYDIGKITAPVVLLQGEMDIMGTQEDATEQKKRLVNSDVTEVVYQAYGHMDFVWDRNARHMLDVVDIAFRYSPGTF